MIAIVERPSGFAIGGGFDVFEPEIAYDAFVRLIRDLAAFGVWSQRALSRFARQRWRELCGEDTESLPHEVRGMLGARLQEGAPRRSTPEQEARALDMIRNGASDAAAAQATGVTRHRARMLRQEDGLTRHRSPEAYLQALSQLQRFTLLRAQGMGRAEALRTMGVGSKNAPEKWRGRIERFEKC